MNNDNLNNSGGNNNQTNINNNQTGINTMLNQNVNVADNTQNNPATSAPVQNTSIQNVNQNQTSVNNEIASQTQNNLNAGIASMAQTSMNNGTIAQTTSNINQAVTSNNNQNVTPEDNTISSQNVNLVKAFIGDNAQQILTSKCNVAGFFIPAIYFLYRRMVGYYIIFIVAACILSLIFTRIYLIIYVIMCICFLFTMNKIYVQFAKKQIDKIIKENPSASYDEIKTLCAEKGGTSVKNVIIAFVICILIGVVAAIVVAMMLPKMRNTMVLDSACNSGPGYSQTMSDGSEISCTNGTDSYICTYYKNGKEMGSKTCEGFGLYNESMTP